MSNRYDSIKDAVQAGKKYKYALIYLMSEVFLGENNREDLPLDEILEARFFDKSGELHIYSEENQWYGSEIRDDDIEQKDLEIYKAVYPLSGEIFQEEKENRMTKLEVWKYLDYDEDGQVYVKRTRCAGVRKGGKADEQGLR